MALRTDDPLAPMLYEYARTGDPELREAIVKATLELVDHVAQRFRFSGEPLDDLLQEGRIGLLSAVEAFDVERGVKFSTYASHAVQGAIQHYLRDKGKLIREPGWLHDLNQRVSKAAARLRQQLGRDPEPGELAADLQLPEAQVAEVMRTRDVFRVSSLEHPAGDEDSSGPSEEERLGTPGESEAAVPLVDRLALQAALGGLREVERRVVEDFFFADMSKAAIAARVGYSPSQVSQILRRALRAMRNALLDQEPVEAASSRVLRGHLEDVVRRDDEPAVRDRLTGVFTMTYLAERLDEELERCRRRGQELSVCVVSPGDLPAARRRGGQLEVERLLCETAEVLRDTSRRSDLVARFDGERFCFLLPETGASAKVLAERCRARGLAGLRCGVAVYPGSGTSPAQLLSAAESALAASSPESPVVVLDGPAVAA